MPQTKLLEIKRSAGKKQENLLQRKHLSADRKLRAKIRAKIKVKRSNYYNKSQKGEIIKNDEKV